MKTFIDYHPRKRQADSYTVPISISAFEKFEWLRDQLKKGCQHHDPGWQLTL
jgi:hypothetical protein